ncbi:hypothetical protein ACVWZ6_002730 [Bradyrhizobium sp. GM6.1]
MFDGPNEQHAGSNILVRNDVKVAIAANLAKIFAQKLQDIATNAAKPLG